MKRMINKAASAVMIAAMLAGVIPAQAFADTGSYSYYKTINDESSFEEGSFDPSSPEMLDITPVNDGKVFEGWYRPLESASIGSQVYIPETEVSYTYYQKGEADYVETSEPDFDSDDVYVKTEYYTPVMNGSTFISLTRANAPVGSSVLDRVKGVSAWADLVADDNELYVTYNFYPSAVRGNKMKLGSVYYVNLSHIGMAWNGWPAETSKDVYVPVIPTEDFMDMITEQGLANTAMINWFVGSEVPSYMYSSVPASRSYDAVYRKVEDYTQIYSEDEANGQDMYVYTSQDIEIDESDYDESDPDCYKVEDVQLTGSFIPAVVSADDSDDTVYYMRANMTPMNADSVNYVGGWRDASADTYTLVIDDQTSVPTVYEPSFPHALPVPSIHGKNFLGWYENEEGTGAAVTESPAASEGAVTYYAVFEDLDQITVTFETRGRGSDIAPQTIYVGEKATVPTADEWQTGYEDEEGFVFDTWYKDAACTEVFDFDEPLTENTVIYAKWTYDKYVTEIPISKTYTDGNSDTAEAIEDTQGKLKETITYTVTAHPELCENRQVGRTQMPDLTPVDITTGDGTDSAVLLVPSFDTDEYGFGDYWYEVKETAGNAAGVTYDETTYWLHLVVADNGEIGVISYALHKDTQTGEKILGFTNEYKAGELTVTKKVTGNMGDFEKMFAVTVNMTCPEGKTVTENITYAGGFDADRNAITDGVIAPADWQDGKASVTVYVKEASSFTLTNIPAGVTYTVSEADYSADGYNNPVYSFSEADTDDVVATGEAWADNGASGSISDAKDELLITNKKVSTIDVGVTTDSMPYMMMMAGAGLAFVLLFRRKYN